ncbi:MAG: STAS domain-containing protein [Candidatus Absconditabacterales bacterium]|nr:STAS domain-containing protein [Candidatus Absconditabacterales bacterium]
MKILNENEKIYFYPSDCISVEFFKIIEAEVSESSELSKIIISFKDISYINSESLSDFSKFLILMLSKKIKIEVCEVNSNLMNIFNITCLDRIVKIKSSNQ